MEIFEEGSILYFEPFFFKDGSNPKPKYFLVIKNLQKELVLASLPTSKDSVPTNMEMRHGCMEIPEINFNCYLFKGGQCVAMHPDKNIKFAFPKNTFVYGFRIDLFDIDIFMQQIDHNRSMVELKGILYPDEHAAIIACLKASGSVKRRFKKLL
ncbi:hypothetical protein [Bacteroides sp.]